jgi:hypothetical protein
MSNILDINGLPIDHIWLAEFRGFFYGEGYLGICSWGKHPKGHTNLRARVQITSRSDDSTILYDIQSKLGGMVYQEGKGRKSSNGGKIYQSNPYTVWRCVRKDELTRICDILSMGVLPSRKRNQIETIREFLSTVPKPGYKTTSAQVQQREQLWNQIKDLHAYSDF